MNAPNTIGLTVGERLEIRRRRRGLSRRVVANLAGRSEEWLRLVESGRRRLDSIEVLLRLAEILQVDDLTELIDAPTGSLPRPDGDSLRALRRVIVDHPALCVYQDDAVFTETDHPGTRFAAPPPRHRDSPTAGAEFDSTLLAAALGECRTIWSASPQRYSRLARRLPAVLRASRAARWRLRSDDSAELLVQTYHVARQLLTGCGEHTMAATVADRSMATSTRIAHGRLTAASAWHVGSALLGLSYPIECRDYALAAAHRLAPTRPRDPADAALWGALHLLAARAGAAARLSHEPTALLATAQCTAEALGVDTETHAIPFGPTEVGITGIEIALAASNPDEAIRRAAAIEPAADYLPARRAKYHICQAFAYVHRRDDVAAALALTKAADLCAEDIRYDQDAHRCVQHLLRRDNYLVRAEVRRLAELAALV
ncbi:hypothetical protein D5S18_27405 [Nocardia panacis]|uniref:HTH cro/C1-type domain-containing protein n=1 Tax=Nocardia panacis TaxID=2340916 RepID=A0A3A4KBQ9_9NOCA|nr:helix-turn-helix domain-containing protein [Nocardia panacis]RJO70910.1 hypothetical protein D5S18_27405 [Nocardia panacis]